MVEITKEQIDQWKEEYGFVYVSDFGATKVYFRTLTRQDYMNIMQLQVESGDTIDPELETVKMCVLNAVADEVLLKKGGYVTVLYEQIMLKSGFVTVEATEL